MALTDEQRRDFREAGWFQLGRPEAGVPLEQEEGDVLVFSSLTMHRIGSNRTQGPRRSWVIQFRPAHARHGDTKVPFDDRLLVAAGGKPLAKPYRDRELDIRALARDAARLRS